VPIHSTRTEVVVLSRNEMVCWLIQNLFHSSQVGGVIVRVTCNEDRRPACACDTHEVHIRVCLCRHLKRDNKPIIKIF